MRKKLRLTLMMIGLLLLFALVTVAYAGSGYDLSWHTLAGGGSTSSKAGYVLADTGGQLASGVSTGNGYALRGGFWQGSAENRVFLPAVVR